MTESMGDAKSGSGSGLCELANQRRLDSWEGVHKETGAKTEHLRHCSAGQYDKTNGFLEH